jgi:hypothetical protein
MVLLCASAANAERSFEEAVDQSIPEYSLEGTPYEEREPSAAFRAMGWATVATAASDVLSTQYILSGGGVETNPLAPKGIKGMVVAKAGATAGVLYITEHLRKTGHEKKALWIRIGTVAAWGYITAHNIRVGRDLREGR